MKKTDFIGGLKFTVCFLLISAVICGISILSSRVFVTSEASAETKKTYTVIIDAGHGGVDGGASGDDGTLEKELNLSVAKKLAALCETAGMNAVMTRTDDVLLGEESSPHRKLDDLKARVDMGRDVENGIFLSIHMNKFPVGKYSGLQVYYSKNDVFSKDLAENIQATVKENLQTGNTRTVKQAGSEIYVLDNAFCPAVLVECGFLSNEEELLKLKDENYQKRLAVCIFAALANAVNCRNTNI